LILLAIGHQSLAIPSFHPELSMDERITIRRAESINDYRACQHAQRRAWGITDEDYVVPIATMVGAQLHGGLVLGAFLPDGEAVGVSFAFLGRVGGRLCLYSQLTGVVPGRQAQGLGFRLKQVQRTEALAAGVALIAWAFDPLQAGNAAFNLTKLGAACGRYVDDMYGPRTDALNTGVPTDRLIAEWDLSAPLRAETPLDDALRLPHLIASREGDEGARVVAAVQDSAEPRVLLEIPVDIASLRTRAPSHAEEWRTSVRDRFRAAFAAGYRAVGFVRDASERVRVFYLLERGQGAERG
jgi:predicted GNAT superfamily acetyltransferase